jgi:hypothetical protein
VILPATISTIWRLQTEILFALDLELLFIVIVHTIDQIRKVGWKQTRSRLGNLAAMAIGLHMLGLTLQRGWNTWIFHSKVSVGYGELQFGYVDGICIPLTGLALGVVGMIACIRIFTPARWGHWGWVMSSLFTVVFVVWLELPYAWNGLT